MSTLKLPSITDDIRQPKKVALNLKPREEVSDDVVDARSREIGERWGSSTQIAPSEPPSTPRAPLVSVRFDSPDYLDRELSVKAAEQGVTKTYLILLALQTAGHRVEDADLVKDRRRWKK